MARKGDYLLRSLNILALLISLAMVVQVSDTWEIIDFYDNAIELCKLLTSTNPHIRSASFGYIDPRIDGFVLSSNAPSPSVYVGNVFACQYQEVFNRGQSLSGLCRKVLCLTCRCLAGMLLLVESGRCMPPNNCGYKFKNATFWDALKSSLGSKGDECLSRKNS
ncbi:unnamed protein product [Dovyalis caffra]|uniref:Gnk2-homologous domain-containing protein n=1 Tax=Dovyalis caffra TaxID=77055 RepID=A0AAV1SPL3_9ROSI|nr:unnamed protein product [Dovyalis caffra]